MSINIARNNKKRIVIVGGGFGGLQLANKLKGSDYQVVLVDKNNYHQFLPLIYQVATAGMEPSSIAFPFRNVYKNRKKNFYFRMAEARAIIPEHNLLQTSIGKIEYDYLVFAAGTTSNFFGNKHFEEVAMPMKSISEAMGLRNALLANFERAITCTTEEEKRELLNIVIVGGGATGIEIAGALSEMKRYVVPKDYPELNWEDVHIYLVEANDKLLHTMSDSASKAAYNSLEKMGVKIILGQRVADYTNREVVFENGDTIPTRSFIWTSGVTAVRIGNFNTELIGHGGRIMVDEHNRVEGLNNVFAIGDQCIQTEDAYPNGHPQLAQVAIQQATLLAANFKRLSKGKDLRPFHYKNLGSMATVGRNSAVVDLPKLHFSGWVAWLTWLVVHLRSILGIRNKIFVLLNWIWNYITYDSSIRLIVYARKAQEIKDRELRESQTHLGEDVLT